MVWGSHARQLNREARRSMCVAAVWAVRGCKGAAFLPISIGNCKIALRFLREVIGKVQSYNAKMRRHSSTSLN